MRIKVLSTMQVTNGDTVNVNFPFLPKLYNPG